MTVTDAMIEAGSRALCRAYQLADGFSEESADQAAAGKMGLNFRKEARKVYLAMHKAAPLSEDVEAVRAKIERRDATLRNARTWLFECWGWLMETDLDMTCPMQVDPLDIVEQIDLILGIEMDVAAASQAMIASVGRPVLSPIREGEA